MGYSHLLVLHTDNGSFHKTKYVIDIVLALRQSGYKVYLMTTSCTVQYINEVPIKVILAWFPRTIFGYCRKEMTIMRSIILAIYASWYPPKKEPTYVICDGSLFTIPILKYYGFYVTFVNYMVSFHHLMTKHSSIKPTPLQLSLLQRADEIIVPSRQCKLCLSHYEIHKGTVIMPCFNRNLYAYTNFVPIPEPKLVSIPYMFTVFGEFKKSSNFSMVIEAFKDLKFMLDDEKYFSKTRLVFVGRTDTLEEKEEYERVKNVLNNAEEEIAGKIFLFDVSDFGRIKTFLRESIALLDITENTLFNIMVIRAQSLGTPTISFNTGFQREIIRPETTGVFIAKRSFAIRNTMHRFIMSKDWAEQLGKAARTDVKERFNSSIFKQDLNYLVMKGNVMKYSAFLEEIPSDTSFNSHSVRTQRSPSSVFES